MSYDITHRGLEGQSGLYARVKRKADGKWWDEVGDAWVSTATSDCDLALTEGSAGVYTDTAGLTPAEGALYVVYVYDAADALVKYAEDAYKPYGKTALQLVNDVQVELRLPQSSVITDAHAKLVLAYINKTIRNFLGEDTVWDELKVRGGFMTVANIATYTLFPVNSNEVDIIRDLKIGTDPPIPIIADEVFREYKRVNTTASQPLIARLYGRVAGGVIIELAPTPDAAYQVDYELHEKPDRLVNTDDVPLLDPDTITLGAIMLARKGEGRLSDGDVEEFNAKRSAQEGSQGATSFGDVDPV